MSHIKVSINIMLIIACLTINLTHSTEYIRVPSGEFMMGCLKGRDVLDLPDIDCPSHEKAANREMVGSFLLSKYEVKYSRWMACEDDGYCEKVDQILEATNVQDQLKSPVIGVTPTQVFDYISWLNEKTGKQHRLPSEIEWEYAARGGADGTSFSWLTSNKEMGTLAELATCHKAQFYFYTKDKSCDPQLFLKLRPVGSFQANGYNLHDMSGNAHELVSDCKYRGNLTNPEEVKECNNMYFRIKGGGVLSLASELRSASRSKLISLASTRQEINQGDSEASIFSGFRLVREE